MKKKNKNGEVSSNNFGETVLVDQKYDGFAPFALDGRDQSRYSYYRKGFWIIVQENEYAIVVDKINPSRNKVRLLGPGLHPSNPVTQKYIYVPSPYSPVPIDFKPQGDQDKKDNFTFTPGLVTEPTGLNNDDNNQSVLKAGQDEIYIDYKVEVRLLDPIRYFNSPRVIETLKATLVSVIREYVAKKDKNTLFANFSNLDLSEIDSNNKLARFRDNYGLEVVSLDINNIKLSDAVQKAKNETAVAKEGINKAKYEYEAAKINAQSSKVGYETIFDLAVEKGLNSDQAVTLLGYFTNREIAKNPNSHVFLSTANSSGQVDPRMMFALYGGKKFLDDDANVIDAEEINEIEDSNVKKRKK